MDNNPYGDLYDYCKVFEVNDLKELAKGIEKYLLEDPTYNGVEGFFSWALLPYYTPFFSGDFYGLGKNAGHIIYRLSDFIPEDERRNIPIYPSKDGTLLMKQLEGNIQWDSLEDWRKSWEKDHPIIPDFIKKLPSALKFLE